MYKFGQSLRDLFSLFAQTRFRDVIVTFPRKKICAHTVLFSFAKLTWFEPKFHINVMETFGADNEILVIFSYIMCTATFRFPPEPNSPTRKANFTQIFVTCEIGFFPPCRTLSYICNINTQNGRHTAIFFYIHSFFIATLLCSGFVCFGSRRGLNPNLMEN